MRFSDRRGFTLIEMAIVVGIIGLLAAILVPIVFNQITSAEQARTEADCRSIATAMMLMRKDTGDWPCRNGANPNTYYLIYGTGSQPQNSLIKFSPLDREAHNCPPVRPTRSALPSPSTSPE